MGCHLLNSPWPGVIKLIPAREILIIDILAGGTGKPLTLFYSVSYLLLFNDQRSRGIPVASSKKRPMYVDVYMYCKAGA
jgi:hypothetical protein